MRRIFLPLLLLCLTSLALAVENQAYLGIFAETKTTRMAGMPAMPDLPPGVDPAMLGAMASMFGGAERLLTVRLWSPSLAPADAFAYLTPPAGLKQGERMDLELYRPKPGQVTDETDTMPEPKQQDFTIKIYWGSSDKVKEGQPKIIRWGNLTDEQKRTMKARARETAKSGATSYFYKPNWTTGYWPTKAQPGKIAKDAALVGTYALTTNYTGNIKLDAPKNVDFLAPLDLVSPKLEKVVPLEPAIKLGWKPIPNVLGLHAVIFAMQGENTLLLWSSSEIFSEAAMSPDFGYMQMAQVREYVDATVMMKGDRTSATVPAGIFKDADMVSLMILGYGPGSALGEGQPLPRIQTKTSLTAMLGGKKLAEGMADAGGDEE